MKCIHVACGHIRLSKPNISWRTASNNNQRVINITRQFMFTTHFSRCDQRPFQFIESKRSIDILYCWFMWKFAFMVGCLIGRPNSNRQIVKWLNEQMDTDYVKIARFVFKQLFNLNKHNEMINFQLFLFRWRVAQYWALIRLFKYFFLTWTWKMNVVVFRFNEAYLISLVTRHKVQRVKLLNKARMFIYYWLSQWNGAHVQFNDSVGSHIAFIEISLEFALPSIRS